MKEGSDKAAAAHAREVLEMQEREKKKAQHVDIQRHATMVQVSLNYLYSPLHHLPPMS